MSRQNPNTNLCVCKTSFQFEHPLVLQLVLSKITNDSELRLEIVEWVEVAGAKFPFVSSKFDQFHLTSTMTGSRLTFPVVSTVQTVLITDSEIGKDDR